MLGIDELTALGPSAPCAHCGRPIPEHLLIIGVWWYCRWSGDDRVNATTASWMIHQLLTTQQYHPDELIFSRVEWALKLHPELATQHDELHLTTLLHDAAGMGVGRDTADVVRLLVARGADVNARDESGATPLYRAVQSLPMLPLGHPNTARLAPPDFSLRQFATIQVLLQRGANPNLPTLDQQYPIIDAAMWGYTSVVALLARYGADVHVRSGGDMTVEDWAEARGDEPLLQLARELGQG